MCSHACSTANVPQGEDWLQEHLVYARPSSYIQPSTCDRQPHCVEAFSRSSVRVRQPHVILRLAAAMAGARHLSNMWVRQQQREVNCCLPAGRAAEVLGRLHFLFHFVYVHSCVPAGGAQDPSARLLHLPGRLTISPMIACRLGGQRDPSAGLNFMFLADGGL